MDIYWFKLNANFDRDDRITLIESTRNGGVVIYHYIKLYCIAARCNQNGGIFIAENMPHTAKTLAKQWRYKEITVKNSLEQLISARLIEEFDGAYYISDWYATQSADKLEQIRRNARLRKQKSRAKQAAAKEVVPRDNNENVTACHGIDKEQEQEKEIYFLEEDKEEDKELIERLINIFNAAIALPKIKFLSKNQREAIINAKAEFGSHRLEQCFNIAVNNEFLNGNNSIGWIANFDWLIKPENIAKVLNGNYDQNFTPAPVPAPDSDPTPDSAPAADVYSSFDLDEFAKTSLTNAFRDL